MAPPPPTPSPSWVLLSRGVRACATDDADLLPEGADHSLTLAAPPRVSVLTVSKRVSPLVPDPDARPAFPFVIATDPSGLILISTPPPKPAPDAGELRTRRDHAGIQRTFRISYQQPSRYFVCDVASATAIPVTEYNRMISNHDLGVIAAPGGGGHFMVAEFQYIVGGVDATLLCFSSENGKWVSKRVKNPLPRWIWSFFDVVSYGGKLWWVDGAAGILSFDPFADKPEAGYVPLPEGDVQHGRGCYCCTERELGSRRRVQLSDGKFRCVEMSRATDDGAPRKVSMRTLADPSTALWTLEYEVSFAEIWADESYKAAGLPEKVPKLAVVHPKNPDVVYFSLEEEHLFGVDLRARKVVECAAHELVQREGGVSSFSVLPFELPESHGMRGTSLDNGATEESASTTSATTSV